MTLIEVDWIDSSSSAGWDELKPSHPDTMAIKSIGFLVHEDKTTITISAHLVRSQKYCHSPMSIPKCAIKKKKILRIIK